MREIFLAITEYLLGEVILGGLAKANKWLFPKPNTMDRFFSILTWIILIIGMIILGAAIFTLQ